MDLNKITFCIPTYERPVECQGAINNILDLYPGARIVVADDSILPTAFEGVEFSIECAHDMGISWKRNKLIKTVATEFVVLMDDDNYPQPGSIEQLWDGLVISDLFALAGMAKHDLGRHRWANSEGLLGFKGTTLHKYQPKLKPWPGRPYLIVDHLPMCFLARREVLLEVPFDERYKTCGEHMDFFLRLAAANGEAGMRMRMVAQRARLGVDGPLDVPDLDGQAGCLFVPGPYFVDTGSRNPQFKAMRRRGSKYRRQMMVGWGITKIKGWKKGKGRHVYSEVVEWAQ